VVLLDGYANFPQVVFALHAPGGFPGSHESGEKHCAEQADNRYHDQ
jgi:hypothetical protein